MMLLTWYWLILVFVIGVVVGSFLNVAIVRLPLEKSLVWPGSMCGVCYQRIRWYDNLPILSYLWLRGRCRRCGASFSPRYLLVELLTGLGFVGLFYLEVVLNVHDWPDPAPWATAHGYFPWTSWAGFTYHAVFFSILLAASATDLMGRQIPLGLTLTGTLIGLVGSTLMPWSWPAPPPAQFVPMVGFTLPEGIQPVPVWWPLPEFLAPGGNWQTGLSTALVGAAVGTFMMRSIGFLFSKGLGKESLGLGDADLMMMVGAFLGWQQVVIALFVSVIPAVVIGVFQMLVYRDNSLPFGPSLAAGSLLTCLGWTWLPGNVLFALFTWQILVALVGFAGVFLFVAALFIRLTKT